MAAVAAVVVCGAAGVFVAQGSLSGHPGAHVRVRTNRLAARAAFAHLPLSFEPNRGQARRDYDYVARGAGYAIGLARSGVELQLSHGEQASTSLRLLTPGGRLGLPHAEARLPGHVSYISADPRSPRLRNLATFGRIVYRNVWPGIDLAFHGRQGVLEYDFDVAAGAQPGRVALAFRGARSVRADGRGGAVLTLPGGRLHVVSPRASQGGRTVASRLVVDGTKLRLALGRYDRSRPLLVDPFLTYSSFLGGGDVDYGEAVAVDGEGNTYITGETASTDFPSKMAAGARKGPGPFVAKLNAAGTALVYSTFGVGGGFISVDSAGDAYVRGIGGVAKLNRAGTGLAYQTRLVGSDLALDSHGDAYVTGTTDSTHFPTTRGAAQKSFGGRFDAFVVKLNPAGHTVYSTYLGGSDYDWGSAIAVDSAGDAYVTGKTEGSFPTTRGAHQRTYGTNYDAFVTKLTPRGTAFDYSTYIGGRGAEQGDAISVDRTGAAYITGASDNEALVAKLSPSGSRLDYRTNVTLPSGNNIAAGGIAVDCAGRAYVAGDAELGLPTTANAYQRSNLGNYDLYAGRLTVGGAIDYLTYLGGRGDEVTHGGGLAMNPSGTIYITGETNSPDYPTTGGALQKSRAGGWDVFLSKLSLPSPRSCPASAPRSAANGTVELVSCQTRGKGKRAQVVCQGRPFTGNVRFTTKARATLSRGRTIYAAGPTRLARGVRQILVQPRRRLTSGRYTLAVTAGRKSLRRTITLRAAVAVPRAATSNASRR